MYCSQPAVPRTHVSLYTHMHTHAHVSLPLCVVPQVTQYSHGSIDLLGIQIDAAINGGNSGGPVFNKRGQCCGIAFQVCWVCVGVCRCSGVVGVRVACRGRPGCGGVGVVGCCWREADKGYC